MTFNDAKDQVTKPVPLATITALLTLSATLLALWGIPKTIGREEGTHEQRLAAVEERTKKNETAIDAIRIEMREGFNRVLDKLDERTLRQMLRP